MSAHANVKYALHHNATNDDLIACHQQMLLKKTFSSRLYKDAYKDTFSLLHGQLIFKITDKMLLWDLSGSVSAV